MVPLADLMQKMLEIENTLPFIRRLEAIFDKQDEKMNNINYKIQRFMSTPEIETKLDIFQQDLFLKMQQRLDRMENQIGLQVDQKANKVEVNDYIKHKANFTDLQRSQERILQLELQINGMIQSQDLGSMHLRETVNKVVADLQKTQNDIARFAKSDELLDIEEKIRNLESFMLENLASSMRNPVELSIDDDRKQFKNKKHLNQHGFGEDYLNLINRRYYDKEPNEFPLKEKASYLQVQNNEIGEKILSTDDIIKQLIDQQQAFQLEIQNQAAKIQQSNSQLQNITSFVQSQKDEQKKIEDFFSQATKDHRSLLDHNKRIEDTVFNLRNEHQKLVDRFKKDHDDFAQKFTRLDVNVDTQHREIELLKSVRRQLLDKIESEIKSMRDLKTNIERKSKDYDERIAKLQTEFLKMKENLENEINQLREPLAIEINKMRQENDQLHEAFETQKNDYRELTGGFLKILNQQQNNGNLSQKQSEQESDGNQLKLKDQFLQKQMMKTFYSETQRISSPFSAQYQNQNDDKASNFNIVPLPDIPKIFLKAQNLNSQHANGIQSARSCSTALTNNQIAYQRKTPAIHHYQSIKQTVFSSGIDIQTPRNYNETSNEIDEKDSMNITGNGWQASQNLKKANSTQQLMSPKALTSRSHSQMGVYDGQRLKKFKHLMENSQKIEEEEDMHQIKTKKTGDEQQSKSAARKGKIQTTLLRNVILMSNQNSKTQEKQKLQIGERPKTEIGKF
eukprot:403360778